MAWTLSQNSTTLTLTPDGTTSANLDTLLDQAITDDDGSTVSGLTIAARIWAMNVAIECAIGFGEG